MLLGGPEGIQGAERERVMKHAELVPDGARVVADGGRGTRRGLGGGLVVTEHDLQGQLGAREEHLEQTVPVVRAQIALFDEAVAIEAGGGGGRAAQRGGPLSDHHGRVHELIHAYPPHVGHGRFDRRSHLGQIGAGQQLEIAFVETGVTRIDEHPRLVAEPKSLAGPPKGLTHRPPPETHRPGEVH